MLGHIIMADHLIIDQWPAVILHSAYLILYYYLTCTVTRARIDECHKHECNATTSGILYTLDNVFIILCQCVKRNDDSAVRCSSKSSLI